MKNTDTNTYPGTTIGQPEDIDAESVKKTLLWRIEELAGETKDIEKIAKVLNTVCQLYPSQKEDRQKDLFDLIGRMMDEEPEDTQQTPEIQ